MIERLQRAAAATTVTVIAVFGMVVSGCTSASESGDAEVTLTSDTPAPADDDPANSTAAQILAVAGAVVVVAGSVWVSRRSRPGDA